MKIKAFVEKILASDDNKLDKISLGKPTEKQIEKVKNEINLDISDYERVIDNYGVKHAFKKHGSPKTEEPRGQVPITADDFEKIPEIVENPEKIEDIGKNKVGNDLILYEKENICYVEGLRESKKKKRKEIFLETLYKRKPKK